MGKKLALGLGVVVLLSLAAVAWRLGRDDPDRDLYRTSSGGNVEAVRAALERGADVDALVRAPGSLFDSPQDTPLCAAAERPDTAVAELLLENGARFDAVDPHGLTALDYAVVGPSPGVVEIVLAHAGPDDREAVRRAAELARDRGNALPTAPAGLARGSARARGVT